MANKSFLKTHFPLICFILFSVLSILLFYIGPVDYNVESFTRLVVYLVFVHIGIIVGYLIGFRVVTSSDKSSRQFNQKCEMAFSIMAVCYIGTVLAMNLLIGFNPIAGLFNPGQARELWGQKQGTLISYLSNWSEIFNIPLISFCFSNWNYISRKTRRITIGLVGLMAINSIATGARHSMFVVLFLVIHSLAAALISGRIKIQIAKSIIIFGILSILIIGVFSRITLARSGYGDETGEYFLEGGSAKELERIAVLRLGTIKSDNWLIQTVPTVLLPVALQGASYLGHGYYGLCLALNMDFTGVGFGLGQSSFGNRMIERFLGVDLLKTISYPLRLYAENGYPTTAWSTSYTWLASDFTFSGSIVFLAAMAFIFGACWRRHLSEIDPIASSLVGYIALMFNQLPLIFILQDPVSFICFYGLVIIFWWKFLRRN